MGGSGKAIPSFQVSAFPKFFVANPSPSGAHVRRIHVGLEACPFGLSRNDSVLTHAKTRRREGGEAVTRILCGVETSTAPNGEVARDILMPKFPPEFLRVLGVFARGPLIATESLRLRPQGTQRGQRTKRQRPVSSESARPGFPQTSSGSGPLILEGRALAGREAVGIVVGDVADGVQRGLGTPASESTSTSN